MEATFHVLAVDTFRVHVLDIDVDRISPSLNSAPCRRAKLEGVEAVKFNTGPASRIPMGTSFLVGTVFGLPQRQTKGERPLFEGSLKQKIGNEPEKLAGLAKASMFGVCTSLSPSAR